jgi:hypothetical protein
MRHEFSTRDVRKSHKIQFKNKKNQANNRAKNVEQLQEARIKRNLINRSIDDVENFDLENRQINCQKCQGFFYVHKILKF